MTLALLCDNKGPSAVCQQKFRTALTLNYLYGLSSFNHSAMDSYFLETPGISDVAVLSRQNTSLPHIIKNNGNTIENLRLAEGGGGILVLPQFLNCSPGGCSANENMTPRSYMISLRKGYILNKILGPRISK